jgi:hypothetical protein
MNFQILIVLSITCLLACQSKQTNALTLIPSDQIVERTRQGTFNYLYATFLNQAGEELSDEERAQLNRGELAKDYYEDNTGVIREIKVRPITLADKFIEIQRRELSSNPFLDITIIEIDCSLLDSIYEEVHRIDQDVRVNSGDMESVDALNQQIVVSAVTKCGFTESHLETIWLVLQHSSSGLIAYYYRQLKQFSEEGKLSKSSMALMEDRLLMWNGYKQVYGSQIQNGDLYDLEDPEQVNERRASMNLGPIQEYISRWNLNFEEEVQKMKKYN